MQLKLASQELPHKGHELIHGYMYIVCAIGVMRSCGHVTRHEEMMCLAIVTSVPSLPVPGGVASHLCSKRNAQRFEDPARHGARIEWMRRLGDEEGTLRLSGTSNLAGVVPLCCAAVW